MNHTKLHQLIYAISALLLLIGIFDMPYGYYTFIRISITSSALFGMYQEYLKEENINLWLIFLFLTAVLFNPFIPIYLGKETWMILDILFATLFVILARRIQNINID